MFTKSLFENMKAIQEFTINPVDSNATNGERAKVVLDNLFGFSLSDGDSSNALVGSSCFGNKDWFRLVVEVDRSDGSTANGFNGNAFGTSLINAKIWKFSCICLEDGIVFLGCFIFTSDSYFHNTYAYPWTRFLVATNKKDSSYKVHRLAPSKV